MSVGLKANVDGTSGTVQVNGNDVVTVNSSGQVGIGTTSPNSKLDVVGDVIIGAALTTGTGASTGDVLVELGANRTGDGPCYIDWHSTAGTDFECRVLRNSGANGTMDIQNTGTGGINLSNLGSAPITLNTAGAERMRIDSSGNVGIGTSSPTARLTAKGGLTQVFNYSGAAASPSETFDWPFPALEVTSYGDFTSQTMLALTLPNDGGYYLDYSVWNFKLQQTAGSTTSAGVSGCTFGGPGYLGFAPGGSERMRITSAGNVGVGTTSPTHKFQVEGQIKFGSSGGSIVGTHDGVNGNLTNDVGNFLFYTASSYGYIWHVGGINRFSIGSVGDLTSLATYNNTAIGSTVVVTSGGAIRRTSSSIKYKKDIENLDPALVTNAVNNLRPVYYRTKNAEGDDKASWSHIGLIAEEVHEVEPRLVRYRTAEVLTDKEGNRVERELEVPEPEDVDYARLSVILLAKVKELETRIAVLEAK